MTIATIEYNNKPLRITHVSEDETYVLATFEPDTETKIFKLNITDLDLDLSTKAILSKINSKNQF